jgi:hypothetical protein
MPDISNPKVPKYNKQVPPAPEMADNKPSVLDVTILQSPACVRLLTVAVLPSLDFHGSESP